MTLYGKKQITLEVLLNLSPPDPGRRETLKFLFSQFFVVPQKSFIKPFEAPQGIVNVKI